MLNLQRHVGMVGAGIDELVAQFLGRLAAALGRRPPDGACGMQGASGGRRRCPRPRRRSPGR